MRDAFLLWMRRHWKMTAAALVAVLGLSVLIPVAAGAQESNTPKEEVIYINLQGDGTVDSIYVVNMFDLDEDGRVVDYGNYEMVRNLTSSDKLVFEDGKVIVNASAGKLYYEGKLNNTVIPWKFDIHYYMDGQEYSADEIAGRSGALRITMAVRENPEGNRAFFEHYGLQITVALDNRKTHNVVAKGATQAIVGSDRQLVFTILPGQEADLEMTADVTDFEMDGITISALSMDLGLEDSIMETGDLKKLTDGVAELDDGAQDVKEGAARAHRRAGDLADGARSLQEGISQLQDGANSLAEGVRQVVTGAQRLDDNTSRLVDGARNLYEGTTELHAGASSMSSGIGTLSSGLAALAAQNGELTDGAYQVFQTLTKTAETQLNAALKELKLPTVTLTPETYDQVLTNLLDRFSSGAYSKSVTEVKEKVRQEVESELKARPDASLSPEQLEQQIELELARRMVTDEVQQQIRNGVGLAALNPSFQSLMDLKAKLDGYQAFYSGLVAYTDGVAAAAQGAVSLSSGATSLTAGTSDVKDGAQQLYSGMAQLKAGTDELLDGLVALQGGAMVLRDGAVQLESGAVKLLNGTIEFYDSTVELQDGAARLADGTSELRSKTADLKDRIREAVKNLVGGDFKPISFVSDKNTNVEFVQFVMKTPSIRAEEETVTAEQTEPPRALTFWQKVVKLFGFSVEGAEAEVR